MICAYPPTPSHLRVLEGERMMASILIMVGGLACAQGQNGPAIMTDTSGGVAIRVPQGRNGESGMHAWRLVVNLCTAVDQESNCHVGQFGNASPSTADACAESQRSKCHGISLNPPVLHACMHDSPSQPLALASLQPSRLLLWARMFVLSRHLQHTCGVLLLSVAVCGY